MFIIEPERCNTSTACILRKATSAENFAADCNSSGMGDGAGAAAGALGGMASSVRASRFQLRSVACAALAPRPRPDQTRLCVLCPRPAPRTGCGMSPGSSAAVVGEEKRAPHLASKKENPGKREWVVPARRYESADRARAQSLRSAFPVPDDARFDLQEGRIAGCDSHRLVRAQQFEIRFRISKSLDQKRLMRVSPDNGPRGHLRWSSRNRQSPNP